MTNKPSCIVLNPLDYIDVSCHNFNIVSEKIYQFGNKVESNIEAKSAIMAFAHHH